MLGPELYMIMANTAAFYIVSFCIFTSYYYLTNEEKVCSLCVNWMLITSARTTTPGMQLGIHHRKIYMEVY
jgi:hypothetical protein